MRFNEVEKLPIDVKKAIDKRVSTRSYEEKSLSEVDRKKLMDFKRKGAVYQQGSRHKGR